MSEIDNFLTASDEEAIVEAIRLAELNTSGEIRVHIEKTSNKHTTDRHTTDRALEVFRFLKIDNTKLQNAVLIYVNIDKKTFAICGDKGINDAVKDSFWNNIKHSIENHFKTGNFKQGLVEGILKSGEQLKKYFPYTHLDTNELNDSISKE